VLNEFEDDPAVDVMRAESVEAAEMIENDALDVVYIDANHQQAYQDAVAWWPKVRVGGYLMGHDYIDPAVYEPRDFITVKQDVDRFASERGLQVTATRERYATWLIHKELP